MTEKKGKKYPAEEELNEKEKKQVVEEPAGVYLNKSKIYTYADYMTWMDDVRRELINGMVYLFGAPTRFHAKISTKISTLVGWFIRKHKGQCEIYHAPFDVRLPKNGETADDKIYTVVQPDICVICDPSKVDDRGCIGAPDLVVEVQSPSTAKRDLNEKFFLYEEAGVREYWVVFPNDKAMTVFLLQANGKFDEGTLYEYEGQVPVSIFKGLKN
jgi:Uma2 family endonuclease